MILKTQPDWYPVRLTEPAFLTTKSTATEYMLTTTAFYLKNVLGVLSSTPPSFFLRRPCIHKRLLRFVTIHGEKSGLKPEKKKDLISPQF